MSRFVTKGRANPWSIPSPHRCHSVRHPGPIHSANDNDDRVSWSTAICLMVVALVGAWFGAACLMGMAS